MALATQQAAQVTASATAWPRINRLTPTDILDAVDQGIRDFRAAPKYGLFFGAFYAVAGWLLISLVFYLDHPYFAYPLATGFALFAPFAATGLYDVSRRLERGEPLSWTAVLGSVRSVSGRELAWMAVVTVFTLVIWLDIAAFLFFAFMGFGGGTSDNLLNEILTTSRGWVFLTIGNLVGAVLAAIVFSYSAVSFPMLFDRNVDFVTAMVTSVKTVLKNPWPMAVWAIIIGVHLALSLVSLFAGLIIVLPILGHTTWHVYRKAVGPVEESSAAPAP
ncbi:MAG TPA: DUF2189 domain-containing protein [Hyphomicrobium sp.]|nr:DUF2189 domain-containing protein [Hyphomicrobium sp.]